MGNERVISFSTVIFEFCDWALENCGLDFDPYQIIPDGKLHRYKMDGDKGAAKTGFATFHLDEFPTCQFGRWNETGDQKFIWTSQNVSEMTRAEKEEFERKKRERAEIKRKETEERLHNAAVKSGELWSKPCLGDLFFHYIHDMKKTYNFSARLYSNEDVFEYFATDERKEKLANGEITIYPGMTMVLPLQNENDQLVSLQQISWNGKFKGFIPGGQKRGAFHVIPGKEKFIFLVEGYATGCTIHELTGCTVYVAFDVGNLKAVSEIVAKRHPNAIKVIASDNDRFTEKPIKNPGQTRANEIVALGNWHNMAPVFMEDEDEGTDWNDLISLGYADKNEVRQSIIEFCKSLIK